MVRANRLLLATLGGLMLVTLPGCPPQQDGANPWTFGNLFAKKDPHAGDPGKPAAQPGSGSGQWVIILDQFVGQNRQQKAKQLADNLVARKWGSIGQLHDSGAHTSFVYYGPFKYGPELNKALKDVRNYRDEGSNVRPFPVAYQMELPPPNPPAPEEYYLLNAPAGATWSLQVAHFVDPGPSNPATTLMKLPADFNRKRAAVEACAELRKRGYPAYYYHGPKMSMVTLGAFPAGAFRFIEDPRNPRYEHYDPATDTYTDPAVRRLRETVIRDDAGKDWQPFRYNLQNGMKVTRRQAAPGGRYVEIPWPSFLVRIPRGGDEVE